MLKIICEEIDKERDVICVDLDGTLAEYESFQGEDVIGNPVRRMVKRVKKMIASGEKVIILSARAKDDKSIKAIEDWTQQHLGQRLSATNVKPPNMKELWDDRCVHVEQNTGRIIG